MRSLRVRLFIAAVLLVLALPACSGGTDAVDQTAGSEFRFVAGTGKGEVIPNGERRSAPAVTAPLLDGDSTFALASLVGKVVVLDFWASWCTTCRVESPEVDQFYRAKRASGVEVVGVAMKDERRAARAFVDRYKISFRTCTTRPAR
jgi:thiol-disulfide isomerase/thioredoxin